MMKNGKRYLLVAIALLLATVLFSGLAMATEAEEAKPIKAIKLVEGKTSFEKKLEGGVRGNVSINNGTNYTIDPADYTEGDIVWSSKDEKIATVSGNKYGATVYPQKPGKVTIVAEVIDKYRNKVADSAKEFTVEFKEVDAEAIVFDSDKERVQFGASGSLNDLFGYWDQETYSYGVQVKPDTATYHEVTWTSKDPDTLLVDKYGNYQAKKLGTVKVVATTTGAKKIEKEATVEIYTKPITSVTFTPDKFEMQAKKTLTLSDYVKYEPENDFSMPKEVQWTSSDPEVFYLPEYSTHWEYDPYDDEVYEYTVRERKSLWGGKGTTGTKEGTSTVTVVVKNFDGTTVTGTCTVTVKPVALVGLSFTKSSLTLKENQDPIDLDDYLKKDPIDAVLRDDDLCWESSNAEVVSVAGGIISIQGAGSAVITVYYKDNPAIEASIVINVSNVGINNVQFDRKKLTLYFVAKPESKTDVATSGTAYFSVEPKDAKAKYATVETTNAKVAVATVSFDRYDNEGAVYVTAVGKGKCKITLYVSDGKTNYTAQLKVTVTDKGVAAKLNKKNVTLTVGKKVTLTAKDSHNVKLAGKWSSSDKSIAKVNKKGVVKGVNPGRCVITFTPKTKSIKPLSCQVKVVKPAN